MNIIKAKRAIVSIGNDFSLEALMMPSGEFRLTLTSATHAIGYVKSWATNVFTGQRPRVLEALSSQGFNVFTDIQQVIIDDPMFKSNLKAKTINLDAFDILLDYAVSQNKPQALALNRALRRNTLVDLMGEAFGLPERTRQERVRSFIKEFARQLTRQDWLDMDKEDVQMIEEQLAFVGER
jgi:hypothetical protein